MRSLYCIQEPESLFIRNIPTTRPPEVGEEVNIHLANAKNSFLAYGKVRTVTPHPSIEGWFVYSVRVIADTDLRGLTTHP